jgi:hypothetical protein
LWLYISFYIILLGAEINAELELQTAVDTTTGRPKPMGKRGAFVADHVAGGDPFTCASSPTASAPPMSKFIDVVMHLDHECELCGPGATFQLAQSQQGAAA